MRDRPWGRRSAAECAKSGPVRGRHQAPDFPVAEALLRAGLTVPLIRVPAAEEPACRYRVPAERTTGSSPWLADVVRFDREPLSPPGARQRFSRHEIASFLSTVTEPLVDRWVVSAARDGPAGPTRAQRTAEGPVRRSR